MITDTFRKHRISKDKLGVVRTITINNANFVSYFMWCLEDELTKAKWHVFVEAKNTIELLKHSILSMSSHVTTFDFEWNLKDPDVDFRIDYEALTAEILKGEE